MYQAKNIILVGPMGSGKTTIGRQLAKQLNLEFFDSDHEIENRTGANIPLIFELEGEEGFRKRETAMLDELSQKKNIVLATGGGAVISPENRAHLSARGIVVYLKTSVNKQLARTLKDKRRPLIQTEDPRAVLEALAEKRNVLYDEVADYTIETDEQSAKVVASKIISLLDF